MIRTRRARRLLNLAGVGIVAALMGYALFAQHVQGYEACPLCILQRIGMIAVAAVMLVAALHAPRGLFARAYAVLATIAAGAGAAVSVRHLYIQSLPPDSVPACGASMDYLLEVFGVFEGLNHILTTSGECADVNWSFLGLAMPAWVLIWYVALAALAIYANWGRLTR